jgi:ABC-type polysaccharide/polyol phosphate export permease
MTMITPRTPRNPLAGRVSSSAGPAPSSDPITRTEPGSTAVPRGTSVTRTAQEVLTLVGRRLRHVVAAPGRLVGVVMNPLVMLVGVGYLFRDALVVPGGGSSYIDFLLAGVAAQTALANLGPTGVSVSIDVHRGLMDRFRSLPISRSAVLVAHSLSDLLIGLGGLAVVVATGLVLGWRPTGSAGEITLGFGVLALFTYVVVWLGIALGMLVRQVESLDAIGALILVVFTFLSSAILSPSAMPAWIRPVAEWNPVSAVSQVCRELWGNPVAAGTSFPAEHPWVVVCVTCSILLTACVVISLRRYRSGA